MANRHSSLVSDAAYQQSSEMSDASARQDSGSVQSLKERIAPYKISPDAEPTERPTQEAIERLPRELSLEEQSLPIVIPQTASKLNAFNSPFVRCYAESLRYKDIDQESFLAFIDGLNECFIGNPAFQGVSIAGAVLQQFYGLSTVQYVGAGLQAAAGLASSAVSYGRTRAYIKAVNVDLFHPAGLAATILKAKKMTEKIGYPTEKISVNVDLDAAPIKEEVKAGMSSNNSFLDRMKSLDGYVAELSLNVPETERFDKLLKRMGAAQSKRASMKQNRRSDKKLAKAKKRADRIERKIEKEERKMEEKVDKLEREGGTSEKNIKEMEKVIHEGEAKIREKEDKRDKRMSKIEKRESKSANKMRWIVITPWQGDDEATDDCDSDVEEREADLSSDEDHS